MRLLPGPLRRRREPAAPPTDGRPDGDLRKGHEAVALERERDAERQRRREAVADVPIAVVGWLDERTGAGPFLRGFLYRKVPRGTSWYYTLGSATMFAFLSQAVTGVFLAMYYRPSAVEAYSSIQHINNDVFLGHRFSVNSKLEKFSPRDPSNHLDGLWQYLYPARPTT